MNDKDMDYVPCRLCKIPTLRTSTRLCDRCWELDHRVRENPAMTLKIIATIIREIKKERT